MNSETAIRSEGLSRTFGPLYAVEGLALEVRKGELYGLVGPDGAGKTTTMRMLASILPPTAGEAWVAGYSIITEGERVKERIGYMSQRFGLYEDLTVMENILFYADIYEVPDGERPERISRLLGFSNLSPFRDRLAGRLSGGMKQKLGLACALIHTPEVLFLDEPTNGVDPVSRRDFWRILYDLLKEGVTIFVSTAYLDEAERCTRIALMHKGKIMLEDTPLAVKRSFPFGMMEVWCDEARAAADKAAGIAGVRSVGVYGDRLHVSLEHKDLVGTVTERLAESGIAVRDSREILPSMEDVFIEMIEKRVEELKR